MKNVPMTEQQIEYFKNKMVPGGKPVRFLNGNSETVNLITGDVQPRHVPVMYKITYWNFDDATIKEIADLTGLKPHYS